MRNHLAVALAAALVAAPATTVLAAGGELFGKPLAGIAATPLETLAKSPAAYDGKTVRTEGTVSAVCQQKGCWMTLDAAGQPIRITFKDYAFFVPKDLPVGSVATLEGVFKVEAVPEATAKHYAGETPGGTPDAIKGAQRELSIEATGVQIVRPKPKKA